MGVDVTAVGVGVAVATAADRLGVAVSVAAGTVLVDVGTVATGVGVTGGNTTAEVSDPHPAPRPPSTIAPINTAVMRCIVAINRSVKPCRSAIATEVARCPPLAWGRRRVKMRRCSTGAHSRLTAPRFRGPLASPMRVGTVPGRVAVIDPPARTFP